MYKIFEIILCIEYIVNLILLTKYFLHMFQLDSYSFKKFFRWTKENFSTVLKKYSFILITLILVLFNSKLIYISVFIMLVSIYFNINRKKAKVKFVFTNRVKRLTLIYIILVILIYILIKQNSLYIYFGILNCFSLFNIIIVNYFDYPIRYFINKIYVKKAKEKLNSCKNLVVIGITGSYGKTSVKNFLYQILSSKFDVLVTPKNYNTTLGVAKTINENLNATHQIFICEMGATKKGDIKEICDIVNPKFGIITSVGPQHLENFKNIDNILKTKFELAESVQKNKGIMFLNYSNKYIKDYTKFQNQVTYGINDDTLDYNAINIKSNANGLKFEVENIGILETKIIGNHNIENLVGVMAICKTLGMDNKTLINQVKRIKSVEHRLQLLNAGNMIIIDNSYNSNPVSSKLAIDTLNQFSGTKILVTPGLIELGKEEERYNIELGEYASKFCDFIFIVGKKNLKAIKEGIKNNKFDSNRVYEVNEVKDAIDKIQAMKLKTNPVILLENDLPDNYS